MRPMCRPSRSSGFTLIELLVTGAVGLIILIAILTTVDLQRGFHRKSDRLLSADSSASLALLPNGDGTTVPVTTLGSASAGVIAGTDAIDIITGNPATVGGFINGIGPVGPSLTFNLDALDPLMPSDLDAGVGVVGPLLAFQAPGVRCVGKLTSV